MGSDAAGDGNPLVIRLVAVFRQSLCFRGLLNKNLHHLYPGCLIDRGKDDLREEAMSDSREVD